MTCPSLAPLLSEHVRFDGLLLQHQTLLLGSRAAESAGALGHYRAALLGHIQGEEEVILPFYEQTVEPPKGGKADYFRAEHRKIGRFLEELAAWVGVWEGLVWPATEVISLIEREKVLKEVMEHHDEREHHFLYPLIEQSAAEDVRRDLAARFWAVADAEERRQLALDPDLAAANQDPATADKGAAALAGGWLEAILESLASGAQRGRAEAPWAEALDAVRTIRRRLQGAPDAAARIDLLQRMLSVVENQAPLKKMPIRQVAMAHSAVQLLGTSLRAARVRGEGRPG